MNTITVQFIDKNDSKYNAVVGIEDDTSIATYDVEIDERYLQKLGYTDVEELLLVSFEFLLEHESKESILSEFNIDVIQKYFPEYEEAIKK